MSDQPTNDSASVLESEPVAENPAVTEAVSLIGKAEATLPMRASSSAVAAQMVAMVQARFVVAERHPRDLDKVKANLLRECASRRFAYLARYKKPMGDKNIEGFSIRFAEAAIREYRNLLVQDMVTHDDDERRIVKVSITDLESNDYYDHDIAVRKTVERRFVREGQRLISSRTNAEGKVVHLVEATEDELEVKQGALISKTIRNLAMRLLPMWLKEECERAIIATLRAEATENPSAVSAKMVEAFGARNINAGMLADYLGHPLATVTADELVELRAVFQTLVDGEATWSEIFAARSMPPVETPPPTAPTQEGTPPPAPETPTSRKAREIKEQVRRQRESSAPAATPASE